MYLFKMKTPMLSKAHARERKSIWNLLNTQL